MIVRSGVSGRNRTDRPTPRTRPIERPCPHGFYTPTRFVMTRTPTGWTEVEVPGDGHCPEDRTATEPARPVWGPTTKGFVTKTAF